MASAPRLAPVAKQSSAPADAVAVDLDGDRNVDIVEVLAGGGLAVRRSLGEGQFDEAHTLVASGVAADRVVASDVTCDGRADLVAYTAGGTNVWVIPADGAGGVLAARRYTVAQGIAGLAVGDFDRNGGPDLAIASATTNEVVLLMNRDDRGGFEPAAFAVAARPLSIASVTLAADPLPDLAVGFADGVRVLANSGGSFAEVSAAALDFSADAMATADLDHDGWADLVVGSKSGAVAVLAHAGDAFAEPVVSRGAGTVERISVGDVDGDAVLDLVTFGAGSVSRMAGSGEFRFAAAETISDGDATAAATLTEGLHAAVLISRPSGTTLESHIVVSKLAAPPVTNTQDAIPAPLGSLRAAVEAANASAGHDFITFAIPTTDTNFDIARLVFSISLVAPLLLTDPQGVDIQGESEIDTNPFGPEIIIKADASAGAIDAFVIPAGSTTNSVSGLIINGVQNAFTVDGSGNTIAGNFIGTDERGRGAGTVTDNTTVSISCGQSLQGTIEDGDPDAMSGGFTNTDTYTFDGAAGETVTFTLTNTTLTGTLQLYAPGATSPFMTGGTSLTANLTVPGVYVLEVASNDVGPTTNTLNKSSSGRNP
jgi:hypothetical protein